MSKTQYEKWEDVPRGVLVFHDLGALSMWAIKTDAGVRASAVDPKLFPLFTQEKWDIHPVDHPAFANHGPWVVVPVEEPAEAVKAA